MVETSINANWVNASYAHSPTGSDDSGVVLSPERSLNISNYDDYCSFFSNDMPESPHCSSVSSQVSDGNLGYPLATLPNHLTPDEIEALSDFGSPPVSVDQQQSSFSDWEDFCSQQYQEVKAPANFDAANIIHGPNDNTQKRRRRQKERHIGLLEAHPGIDPCLVPKSGTAKPRQSRKRRRTPTTESMAGGQGGSMNYKRCYTGARVKVTAKERLQQLRSQQADVAASEPSNRTPQAEDYDRAKRIRYVAPEAGSSFSDVYRVPSVTIPADQPYRHSVSQILDPQRYVPDKLEMCIRQYLNQDQRPLSDYAEQHARANSEQSYSGREESTLITMICKLNEKKGLFEPEDMRKVTEFFCSMFRSEINKANLNGETPIYKAALYGNEGVVQGLMCYGANPWQEEKKGGETALHAAVRSKLPGVVNAILDNAQKDRLMHGINSSSCDDNTPLHTATALTDIDSEVKKEIVQKLLQCGADTTKKNHMSQMPHSFLTDPKLKDLQNDMKRLSQRRRPVPAHPVVTPIDPQLPYCHPTTCTTQQYPTYSYEPRIQPPIQHISPNMPQQYPYSGLQHATQHYPSVSTQYVGYSHMEPRLPRTNLPPYYDSNAPNVPTTETLGSQQEFDDFLGINYSS